MRSVTLIVSLLLAIACRADELLVGPVELRVQAVDSLLEPGRPLQVVGDVRAVKVRIGGLQARVVRKSNTLIEISVPDSLFSPCLRGGVHYPVDLRRGRQRMVLILPAAAVPFRLSLEPGEHAFATEGVARGCAVELPDSGQYLAMPFTWDRADGDTSNSGPVLARVTITPVTRVSGTRPLGRVRPLPRRAYGPDAVPEAEAVTAGPYPWAPLAAVPPAQESTRPGTPAACPALPEVGDSLALPTTRRRSGLFTGFQGAGQRPEYWRVVGTSSHLVVLFDRQTLLRARQDPNTHMRLLNFLNDFEALVAPFLARELPHWEDHARIPVLMTDTAASKARGLAYPSLDLALTCLGRLTNGGFIWLDGAPLFRFSTARQARLIATAAHETAHLVDFGLRLPPGRERHWRWWTIEGYAEAVRHLWAAQDLPAPFTGNLSEPPAITTATGATYRSFCGLESDRAKLQAMPTTLDYGMACRMVSALLARAVVLGQPLEQVLERFSALPDRQSFTQIANALTGTVRPPNEVVGEWLLSWYADELPGTSSAIQDPVWNLRRFYRASALVDARVSIGGGESSLALEELDVRYLEITTAGTTRIAYTSPTGAPLETTRTDLAVLRVR